MKIYLASPFFTEYQRNAIYEAFSVINKHLTKIGYNTEWFIPMEHFVEGGEYLPNHIWGKKVFLMDKVGIDNCDTVIALDFGFSADSGTAWEIGYAFAKFKKVYCINMGDGGCRSLMLVNGCTEYFNDLRDFVENFSLTSSHPSRSGIPDTNKEVLISSKLITLNRLA